MARYPKRQIDRINFGVPPDLEAKMLEHCAREGCTPQDAARELLAVGFSLYPIDESVRQARQRAFLTFRREVSESYMTFLRAELAKFQRDVELIDQQIALEGTAP